MSDEEFHNGNIFEEHELNFNPSSIEEDENVTNCNPSSLDNDDSDEDQILLGDAIEGTLYSSRFVLNTLLKLKYVNDNLESDRKLEDDLCYLWDMTMEKEIIEFLLEQEVLDIFAECIKNSKDKRLVEILVGIMANMCRIKETCNVFLQRKDVLLTVLSLFACSDVLTLIQTGRFLHTIICKLTPHEAVEVYSLFPDVSFMKCVVYILYNSVHDTLLETTMETLDCVLRNVTNIVTLHNEADDTDYFQCISSVADIIEGTIEAFQTLFPETNDEDEDMEGDTTYTTTNIRRMTVFLRIHETLTLFTVDPPSIYIPYLDGLCDCFQTIANTLLRPEPILPLKTFEFDSIETIAGMLKLVNYHFDSELFDCILRIWCKILDEIENEIDESIEYLDWESEDDRKLFLQNLKDIITETILKMNEATMNEFLQNTTNTIDVLLRTEKLLNTDPRMAECIKKVKKRLNELERMAH